MINKTQKGFTLIELFLYLSIASVVLFGTSLFIILLLQTRVKNQTIAEVEQQGLQIMQVITQDVRNGTAVNSPAQGAISNSLSINLPDASKNPVIFDLSNGVVRIKEGTAQPIALNNSRVSVSGLSFKNLSQNSALGAIRIQFTITYINSLGRNEYDYSKTFYASSSIR